MPVGRPRAFCIEKALDSALTVFWKKGYEGTSLPDLTDAMGIKRPSLYAAFGNKEALFMKALARYEEKTACVLKAMDAASAREGVAGLLEKLAEKLTDPDTPHGCLAVSGALACSEETDRVKQALAEHRSRSESAIRDRLVRARNEGELPPASDPAALARYFTAVMQGMAVQASGGATQAQLRGIAATSLLVWPV